MFTAFRLLLACAMLAAVFAVAPQMTQTAQAACGVSIYRIYYDSPGTDNGSNASLNGEWIQLKNNCTTAKPINSWTIKDASGHRYRFGTYTLGANAMVKVHTGNGTNTKTDRYWRQNFYVWNNTGTETAKLRSSAGTVIDSCTYNGTSAANVYC